MRGTERLKLRADSFFLPVDEGIWLRNNRGSFTIKSRHAHQWLERLAPLLDGTRTLDRICEPLSKEQKAFVFNLLQALQRNGFLKEVTESELVAVPEALQRHFAQQLEFLDHYADVALQRFERYRKARFLCAGGAGWLASLIGSLLESGATRVDAVPDSGDDLRDLAAVVERATRTYPDVAYQQHDATAHDCERLLAQHGDVDHVTVAAGARDHEKLLAWSRACRARGKTFIGVVSLGQALMVGPLVTVDSAATWECAWRRLHDKRQLEEAAPPSAVSLAVAAHTVTYDLFKLITGVMRPDLDGHVVLLDEETLTSKLHAIIPHPLRSVRSGASTVVAPITPAAQAGTAATKPAADPADQPYDALTDNSFGILASIEPGDLPQLPLNQCRCWVSDPLAFGGHQATAIRVAGLAHVDVWREGVLLALARYATRLATALPAGGASPELPECPPELLGEAIERDDAWIAATEPVTGEVVRVPAGLMRSIGAAARTPEALPAGLAAGLGATQAVVRAACSLALSRVMEDQAFLTAQTPDVHAPGESQAHAYARLIEQSGRQFMVARALTPLGLPWAGVQIDGRYLGQACHVSPQLALDMALGQAAASLLAEGDGPCAVVMPAPEAGWDAGLASLRELLERHGFRLFSIDLTLDPAVVQSGYRVARAVIARAGRGGAA